MNKKIFLLLLTFSLQAVVNPIFAITDIEIVGKKKIKFSASETDANIWINGVEATPGNTLIVVAKEECVTVLVKKVGFISVKIKFCNKKNAADLPKSYFLEMKEDDSFLASELSQDINRYIKVESSSLTRNDAWKALHKTVLNYFDVIELMDDETGYLYTAWNVKSFTQNTVRTRIIVKEDSQEPLSYKIKLVSEYSGQAQTAVKSDIKFKEWERVLKNYKTVVEDLQGMIN